MHLDYAAEPSRLYPQPVASHTQHPPNQQPASINPASLSAPSSSLPNTEVGTAPAPTKSQTLHVRHDLNMRSATTSPAPSPRDESAGDSPFTDSPATPFATSHPTTPNQATSDAWKRILPHVRQQLEGSNSKYPVRAASKLAECLHPFVDSNDPSTSVPIEGRREVLDTLLSKAPREFFVALAQTDNGRAVIESWCSDALVASRKDTSNKPLLQTLLPCLRVSVPGALVFPDFKVTKKVL